MKQLLVSIAITSLVFLSCNKSNSDDQTATSLNGKWRMISVKNQGSNVVITKPSSLQGEVEITFTATSATTGTFTGITPTNDIWLNDYSTGANQSISIPSLGMTKVGEYPWGQEFVDNIRSAQKYSLEDGDKLHILTTNKTLTFKKL